MRDAHRLRDHMAASRLSPKTIDDYLYALHRLHTWAADRGQTVETISPYLLLVYVERQVPNTRSSRGLVRDALRIYWTWRGCDDARMDMVAARVPSEPQPECRALDPSDAAALHKVAADWDTGPEGVAVLLGLHQALRRAEIASLMWRSFTPDGWMRVVGKGNKEARLPVHPLVLERLAWWKGFTVDDPADQTTTPGGIYLFAGKSGPHVHPATVWTWSKKVGEAAGVELTTHELRHTAIAEVNERTRDLRAAQRFARHARSSTTDRYTRVSRTRLVEAVMETNYEWNGGGGEE